MSECSLTERILSKEVLYDGRIAHVEKWQVALPNGRTAVREAVLHCGAVAVVAADAEGRIAMVTQFRVVMGREMLEIPAGKLDDPNENPLQGARRELREETGLTANRWDHLAEFVSSPGFCNERIDLYLATDLVDGETDFDDDEFLHASRLPADTLYEMVYDGRIDDGKSIAALLLAKPRLEAMGLIKPLKRR